ncbi:hypothetical protein ASE38_02360 [Cellulomonas sp. Root930]|nr:hypothetical protein ASE38_02360 [Cellulomonas sp. Root930]
MSALGSPRHRHALAALVAALLLALLGASVSSASALSLNTGKRQFTSSQGRCTSQAVAVTTAATSGSASSVSVSNLDVAGCTGKALVVVVYDASSSTWTAAKRFEVSGTVTAAATALSSVTTSFTPASAQKVYVTVGGWPVPAAWSYTGPATTGPVTPGVGVVLPPGSPAWTITSNGKQFCTSISVTGTSPTGQPWTVDLRVDQRPFNGGTSASQYQLDEWNGYAWTTTTAVGGVLKITGTGSKATISSSQTYTIQLCQYDAPPPLYDPALAYTTTSTVSTDANNACITTTVAVSGAYPFFAGWRADVDMAPAFALRTSAGLSANTVEVRTGGIVVAPLTGQTYRFTPNGWGTYGVRDAGGSTPATAETFIACVK